ncbi:Outer-membrane-phospholipid-binding lipoprotein MlaA [hydrothermal vent metagenome]|uniref:Outer-membrane-phospholipid-binding lipoprotein MlaA n=1 Tax=hydrothermal vent metagenome TaxID=652676 RepID=A0A3B0XG67_9ZZZZ
MTQVRNFIMQLPTGQHCHKSMKTNYHTPKLFQIIGLLITYLLSSGCATLDGPPNPDDPFESYNRSMFAFNETVDKYAFKPAAEGYQAIMPNFASKGVSNFFSNVDDIVVFVNQLLQFKLAEAVATSARFVFNTTFGLLGLIDVASDMDLPKHNEDFGQTLATWGVGSGPYIVMPLIGPLTIRDTAGLAVDWTYFDPIFNRQTLRQSLVTLTIKYIDVRAGLLKATNILDETVPDKYAFVRDAYLSRREFLIYDGNPPDDFNENELFDDEGLFEDDLKSDDLKREENLNKEALHKELMKSHTEISVE